MIRSFFTFLIAFQLITSTYAEGDHDCVIFFRIGVVNADGSYSHIQDCDILGPYQLTVGLAPGEQVRITRFGPGNDACPGVGLQRRVHAGPEYATIDDPIVDTLSIGLYFSTEIGESGSYHLIGIPLNPSNAWPVFTTSLQLIINQSLSTSMNDTSFEGLQLWPSMHGLVINESSAGELYISDMAGQLVKRIQIQPSSGQQVVFLSGISAGAYVAMLLTDQGVLRRRFLWP
ncbi:MAG TPA: T9SS type A sorting domain-containing protein [Flavobacteriales bacterium]|nr:T9SS type A sorting domain-containing protein [Flavobacteriales bacterium]